MALGVMTAAAQAQVQQAPELSTKPSLAAAEASEAPPCTTVPPGAQRLSGGGVQAWWLPEPSPLRVGQAFAVLVSLCPAQARLLRVDAQMPEHRHGMNYRPSLQPLGEGRWRAEGLLWHMPGRWELLLEASLGDQRQRLTQSVQLR
jgi:hypothetical protein